MEAFFLDPPIYAEPEQSVRLTLKNNIIMRKMRQEGRMLQNIGADSWMQMDEVEHAILTYMMNKGPASRTELAIYTGKSPGTISDRLKN